MSTGGDKPGGDPPADKPATAPAAAPAPRPLTAEEKAKIAAEQADALAALEAEERGEKPAPRPAPTPVAAAPAPAAKAAAAAAKPVPPSEKANEAARSQPPVVASADDDPNRLPTAPPWWKTLRADPPAAIRMVLGGALLGLLLLLWFFITLGDPVDRIISPSKLPSPGEIFGSFGVLMKRDIGESIADTLQRVMIGVLLASLVGVSVGVMAASHRGVGAATAPLVIFLRSVPMGALIPLTLLLFGDEEKQKTMFIFLAIVPFVFSDTVKAISIVPERYVETAQTLGASRWQIIRKVLVPLALPDIITSLRFQLGLALGYIMLVEEINTEHGLGKLIMGSQRQGPYEHVYLLLFVIALIAFSIDLLLRTVQRGVFAWRKDL
ncbi:MAG: ABC transporter permease [Deltaproteobacteria bacterium]|nr:ABC transporter permease [Deltaproteobacteria bacterium]